MPSLDPTASLDKESKALIYDGMNISQIAAMVGRNQHAIRLMVQGVQHAGTRNGYKIWRMRDIAGKLWQPTAKEIDEAMQRMTPDQLPKMLSKEYWTGQRARQEFELKAGNLWPTEQVVAKVGEIYKIVAMSAKLMSDEIERQTELSDRQRDIVKARCDSLLVDIAMQIKENFRDPKKDKFAAIAEPPKPVNLNWEDDDDL